ncbi:MAG TPA: DUF3768 domain-containing protein [Methylocella sp.]|nr:DUF3768 domain-containing protein [Methylocella sp.]
MQVGADSNSQRLPAHDLYGRSRRCDRVNSGTRATAENPRAPCRSRINKFDPDNDPHHEHDLAFFDVDGERYFFKVDYYDLSTRFHSPDPADPECTCRVLTIGHHSDY